MNPDELQKAAREHLWMHFSRLGHFAAGNDVEIMVRGEGCYVWDAKDRKYLDGLSGLFVVQIGHGRAEVADVLADQAKTLEYFPIWSYAHPPAIELAAKLAALAPGDLNRVFFTSGGSEAVESAWKLARQYHRARGEESRYKVIARDLAYHGTTMGALAITGLEAIKAPFEPLMPGTVHVANTNQFRPDPQWPDPADAIEAAILAEGPETVAAVFLEPVQNAGGCFVPPEGYFAKVREICDRHGVLLVSDEVICAFGRLGHWFGCEPFGYQPDMITFAKGATSGYAPLGGVLCSDRIAEPFLEGKVSFAHGITFAGHPVSCAAALKNIEIFERDSILDHVRAKEPEFRARLESLRDIPMVGDVRGAGYFYALELVKDSDTLETFDDKESEELLRGFLSPRLYEAGLICRADDRGDPIVQLAPPLVSDDAEFDFIETTLRTVLTEAWKRIQG
jgi:adenosylmethionine-8-amino-7-oxononanoate aminotransferase